MPFLDCTVVDIMLHCLLGRDIVRPQLEHADQVAVVELTPSISFDPTRWPTADLSESTTCSPSADSSDSRFADDALANAVFGPACSFAGHRTRTMPRLIRRWGTLIDSTPSASNRDVFCGPLSLHDAVFD